MPALIVLTLFVLSPIILAILGLKTVSILAGIYVLLSLPSIFQVVASSLRTRTLPKIVGGPRMAWSREYKAQ